jgi:hypothetical protein
MAKRSIRCGTGERRFTVIRVDGDPHDTHAARSFQAALAMANPDRGARLDILAVCASDEGAARLPSTYKKRGQLLRTIRYKRG